jgi:hypothetical protein
MIIFEVVTPLKKKIKLIRRIWEVLINLKHLEMRGKENLVLAALENPDEIRRSKTDESVYLYYKKLNGRWIVIVCKHLNSEGFIITAYITDRIKEGEIVWKTS